ncbi:hypothetical protein ACFLS1_05260, partial [Verrucomicrobiota bacterium]
TEWYMANGVNAQATLTTIDSTVKMTTDGDNGLRMGPISGNSRADIIQTGGSLGISNTMYIAFASSSTGTVTISDGGLFTIKSGDSLSIGRLGNGTFSLNSSTGSVGSSTYISDGASFGNFYMTNSMYTCGSMYMGDADSATATTTISNSTLTANGTEWYMANGVNAQATLTTINSTVKMTSTANNGMYMGNTAGAKADIIQSGGSFGCSNRMYIANIVSSTGTVTVSDGGTFTVRSAENFLVANRGNGTLTLNNSTGTVGLTYIGYGASSEGKITISNSSLSVSTDIRMPNNETGNGTFEVLGPNSTITVGDQLDCDIGGTGTATIRFILAGENGGVSPIQCGGRVDLDKANVTVEYDITNSFTGSSGATFDLITTPNATFATNGMTFTNRTSPYVSFSQSLVSENGTNILRITLLENYGLRQEWPAGEWTLWGIPPYVYSDSTNDTLNGDAGDNFKTGLVDGDKLRVFNTNNWNVYLLNAGVWQKESGMEITNLHFTSTMGVWRERQPGVDTNITYMNTARSTPSDATLYGTNHALMKGWNLLAWPYLETRAVNSAKGWGFDNASSLDRIIIYENDNNRYVELYYNSGWKYQGSAATYTMQPNQAFWYYRNANGTTTWPVSGVE